MRRAAVAADEGPGRRQVGPSQHGPQSQSDAILEYFDWNITIERYCAASEWLYRPRRVGPVGRAAEDARGGVAERGAEHRRRRLDVRAPAAVGLLVLPARGRRRHSDAPY